MAKNPKLVYEAGVIPKSAAAINAAYIIDYYTDAVKSGKINQKQLKEWNKFVAEVKSSGDSEMKQFATIRREFVARNFPTLVKKQKTSMLDALKALEE